MKTHYYPVYPVFDIMWASADLLALKHKQSFIRNEFRQISIWIGADHLNAVPVKSPDSLHAQYHFSYFNEGIMIINLSSTSHNTFSNSN